MHYPTSAQDWALEQREELVWDFSILLSLLLLIIGLVNR